MQSDKTTLASRQLGTLPDRYWYQLNGESVQENYQEQKAKLSEDFAEQANAGDEEIYITSEVKLK